MTSLTKNPHSPGKNFFRVQSTRLADPFEPLNSSLAQSTEELGRWYGNQKLPFFCENHQNHPDAKVLKSEKAKSRCQEALGSFMKLELKRYEKNLTINFINYTPDKLLKMYCKNVFFLRLSPCVFPVPSHCSNQSIMLLFILIQIN